MTDLLGLLNKAIEKELGSSMRYMWQHLVMGNSCIGDAFKNNSLEKLWQAIRIGEYLFEIGDIPEGVPQNVGNSLKEMIEFDLKSENAVINIYQEIIGLASEEEDVATRLLFEKILAKEQERKRVLICLRGRAIKKLM